MRVVYILLLMIPLYVICNRVASIKPKTIGIRSIAKRVHFCDNVQVRYF